MKRMIAMAIVEVEELQTSQPCYLHMQHWVRILTFRRLETWESRRIQLVTVGQRPLFATEMERYDSVIRTYGKDGFDKIQAAKLLVVGAGGIGCEVSS
jgi:pyruvate/2-oxoglutarate dehydrogenase complex dihydrolipoamide dehydrogenase (E3) component